MMIFSSKRSNPTTWRRRLPSSSARSRLLVDHLHSEALPRVPSRRLGGDALERAGKLIYCCTRRSIRMPFFSKKAINWSAIALIPTFIDAFGVL